MFYLYSNILTVLSQKILLFSFFQANPISLAGCVAFLASEIRHENFVFDEDLNQLLKLMEGKPLSGEYDKDQKVGGKEGSRTETSQRKGPEGGIFALSQVYLKASQPPVYFLQKGCNKWNKAMQVMK